MSKKIDVSELMTNIQAELSALNSKMDVLMTRAMSAPAAPKPSQQQGNNNNHKEKTMYKAVCADCRKDCEVPFKPTGERPVYCKECFSKRRAVRMPNVPSHNVSRVPVPVPEVPAAEPKAKSRSAAKKKPAAKKRKTGK